MAISAFVRKLLDVWRGVRKPANPSLRIIQEFGWTVAMLPVPARPASPESLGIGASGRRGLPSLPRDRAWTVHRLKMIMGERAILSWSGSDGSIRSIEVIEYSDTIAVRWRSKQDAQETKANTGTGDGSKVQAEPVEPQAG